MKTKIVTLMAVFIVISVDGLDITRAQFRDVLPKIPKRQTQNKKPTTAVDEYKKKVCANEPSCDLINTVPEYLRQMPNRNCMCDVDCIPYGECCQDSKYYNETEQRRNYLNFYCAFAESNDIYIKNTCLSTFTDIDVVNKCRIANSSFHSLDRDLVALVTDPIKNITYANKYCALCNRIDYYVSWNVSYSCNNRYYLEPDNSLLEKASRLVKLNETSGKFYADFEGNDYDCLQNITPPPTIEPDNLRSCVPLISSCKNTTDKEIVGKCESIMSIVYDGTTIYKNKYCAICNGVPEKQIAGCSQVESSDRVGFSSDWAVGNKAGGSGACGSNANEAINEKFSCE